MLLMPEDTSQSSAKLWVTGYPTNGVMPTSEFVTALVDLSWAHSRRCSIFQECSVSSMKSQFNKEFIEALFYAKDGIWGYDPVFLL